MANYLDKLIVIDLSGLKSLFMFLSFGSPNSEYSSSIPDKDCPSGSCHFVLSYVAVELAEDAPLSAATEDACFGRQWTETVEEEREKRWSFNFLVLIFWSISPFSSDSVALGADETCRRRRDKTACHCTPGT